MSWDQCYQELLYRVAKHKKGAKKDKHHYDTELKLDEQKVESVIRKELTTRVKIHRMRLKAWKDQRGHYDQIEETKDRLANIVESKIPEDLAGNQNLHLGSPNTEAQELLEMFNSLPEDPSKPKLKVFPSKEEMLTLVHDTLNELELPGATRTKLKKTLQHAIQDVQKGIVRPMSGVGTRPHSPDERSSRSNASSRAGDRSRRGSVSTNHRSRRGSRAAMDTHSRSSPKA